MQVYLDNSATTRPCPQAVEAVAQSMTEAFHNPSALYAPAMRAEHALTDARRAIAATLGAQEKNVIFTSGGTESDNLAIWGRLAAMHHPGEVLYTAAEHEAVKNAAWRPRRVMAWLRGKSRSLPAARWTWPRWKACWDRRRR